MKGQNGIKVLVVCGGDSTERDISLQSGVAVYEALRDEGFNADILDINNENIRELLARKPDVVYIALHGKGGEDGSIQGLLEWFQIPYTGPGVTSSAICMDKILTKDILVSRGVETPKYAVVNRQNAKEYDADRVSSEFGLPVVVKAACQGSSIGMEIITEAHRINAAIKDALTYGDNVLIEQFVKGQELTVPIIGNNETQVLPIIEITSENEFYDYKSKYTPGMSHHFIPARISEETQEAVIKEAVKAYHAVGCRGISRIDIIVDDNNVPYVIEINTSPGMTETSLVPDAAKHAGKTFGEFVTEVVTFAIEQNNR